MTDCHTLIVSDIHLGSRVCRADKILDLLRTARFDVLVVNGDLFDGESVQGFDAKHWEIIESISEIAKRSKVFLVGGNHGRTLDALAQGAGMEIKDDYVFNVGGRRILCIHGDQFDVFIKYLPLTTRFFSALYEFLQSLGGEKQKFSMFMKRFSKNVLRVPVRQERMARRYAAEKQASVVICSHTHLPHEDRSEGLHFINSGSFCEYPCNYVTIDRDGTVELKEI